ncbi:MAG: hypothetical protein DYG98_15815 [Haliscomenobacteraceae bacterium CHB4]|nr:hypothetical protein [Saprospiraceae bacterium]MCE7924513.1 hypothetical protein [Haliscomenobacteraceae bacterium CHB4]
MLLTGWLSAWFIRLRKAAELLLAVETNISEVAWVTGFNDPGLPCSGLVTRHKQRGMVPETSVA